MFENNELTALNLEQEQEFLRRTLYDFVIRIAQNSKAASPEELGAMPEIAKLIYMPRI